MKALNVAVASFFGLAGAAQGQDMVVKIGHVGSLSGALAHLGAMGRVEPVAQTRTGHSLSEAALRHNESLLTAALLPFMAIVPRFGAAKLARRITSSPWRRSAQGFLSARTGLSPLLFFSTPRWS